MDTDKKEKIFVFHSSVPYLWQILFVLILALLAAEAASPVDEFRRAFYRESG
jgi:hypothetical protein